MLNFMLKFINLKIKKIAVEIDGKGLGSEWKLEFIKIMVNNQTYKY
jgi:hypothetical protein